MGGGAVWGVVALVSPLLLLVTVPVAAQVESCVRQGRDDVAVVNRFIALVRDGEPGRLAEQISFPLRRKYPLPGISRDEFIDRYDEILDAPFAKLVVSSRNDDCGRTVSGGLQLHSGLVRFSEDGRISSIDYESEFEERERHRLVELERRALHESLRAYHSPVLEWETCTHRVRVDRVDGGYRYAAWSVDQTHDEEPDLVVGNGTRNMEGTLGDHGYYFANGQYKYILFVDATSTVSAGDLEVYRTRLDDYYDVRYKSEDHEILLAAQIVNSGGESRFQALLNRLRMCSNP